MALLRPSELARVWELHPRTVYLLIREGRLPAIKTPGAQYRVRSDDARAYCEKNGLPMPRGVSKPAGTLLVVGKATPAQRAIVRAFKSRGADVTTFTSALEGLLAAASDPPDVLVMDATGADVALADAVRALRKAPQTSKIPLVVFNAAPRAVTFAKQGSTFVVPRGKSEEPIAAVTEALELRLTPQGVARPRDRG